jgi:hypothetical protein
MIPDSILFWKRAALLLFEDSNVLIDFYEIFALLCFQLMAFSLAVYSENYIFFPFNLLLILFCTLGFILFLSLIMIRFIYFVFRILFYNFLFLLIFQRLLFSLRNLYLSLRIILIILNFLLIFHHILASLYFLNIRIFFKLISLECYFKQCFNLWSNSNIHFFHQNQCCKPLAMYSSSTFIS